MNSRSRPTGTRKAGTRRKKPATIDLKAKEVEKTTSPSPKDSVEQGIEGAHNKAETAKGSEKTFGRTAQSNSKTSDSSSSNFRKEPAKPSGSDTKGKGSLLELSKSIDGKNVAAGLIGAVAMTLLLSLVGQFQAARHIPIIGVLYSGTSEQPDNGLDTNRISELQAQIDELKAQGIPVQAERGDAGTRLAEVEKAVAKLAETISSMGAVNENSAANAELASSLATVTSRLEALEADLKALPTDTTRGASPESTGLAAEIDTRLSKVEKTLTANSDTINSNSQRLETITGQASALETTIASVKASEKVALAVAVNTLGTALENDDSVALAFASVESLTGNSPEIEQLKTLIEAGLPTRQSLLETLADFTFEVQNPAADTSSGSISERFWANAQNLVSFRSSGPQKGDTPVAILSRIKSSLEAGNLKEAASEWLKLPDPIRSQGANWSDLLDRRIKVFALYEEVASQFGAKAG